MSCRIALWDCFFVIKLSRKLNWVKISLSKTGGANRYNTDPVSVTTLNEAILARGVVNREL